MENIAGVDEVGRGPLAGPVVASAIILAKDHPIIGLRDSKKLTKKRREELYPHILEHSLGKMVRYILAIGKMIKSMEKELL